MRVTSLTHFRVADKKEATTRNGGSDHRLNGQLSKAGHLLDDGNLMPQAVTGDVFQYSKALQTASLAAGGPVAGGMGNPQGQRGSQAGVRRANGVAEAGGWAE